MKTAIDIEHLLQWAVEQSVAPRLTVASRDALSFNYGFTVVPKGFHGVHTGGIARVEGGRYAGDIDAERVLAAIDRLDPWSRSVVLRCAKGCRRPDWFEGVEPQLVPRISYRRKKNGKKKHRKSPVMVWKDGISPQVICATRDIYRQWHIVLSRLAAALEGKLLAYEIKGFAAPAAPWETALEKAA